MARRILVIGIGGSGCKSVSSFINKMKNSDAPVTCLFVDTDGSEAVFGEHAVSLSCAERLHGAVSTLDRATLDAWFPYDFDDSQNEFLKSVRMDNGTGLWRAKALLMFARYMSSDKNKALFCGRIDEALGDASDVTEIYVVASLAGGTGSGLFLPITLFVKKYIRQTAGKDVNVTAFLIGADVYESVLSAEQRVKANSNAYAALKELNAVNTAVSEGGDVRFRLGDETDKALGLLFDADNAVKSAVGLPFGTVYMFERHAGIQSPAVHVEMVSDALAYVCRETKERTVKLKCRDAVFGGIQITKIAYPKKSIADYICKKKLTDALVGEWQWLHTSVKHTLMLDGRSAVAKDGFLSVCDSDYRRVLSELSAYLTSDGKGGAALLGRESDDGISFDFSAADYYKAVADKVDGYLCGAACERLIKYKEETEKRFSSVPFFGIGKQTLYDVAADFKKLLCDYYSELQKIFSNKKEEFIADITATEGAVSIFENILGTNGCAVHPVYAAVRLCALAGLLRSHADAYDCSFENTSDGVPNKYFIIPVPENAKCKYARGEDERFPRLTAGDLTVRGTKKADVELLLDDIECAFVRMKNSAVNAFIKLLADEVDKKTGQYIRFFNELEKRGEDFSRAVSSALRRDSSSLGGTVNIHASAVDKEQALYEYEHSSCGKSKELLFDGVYETARSFISKQQSENYGDAFEHWFSSASDTMLENFIHTDFYLNFLNKNILEAMLGSDFLNGDSDGIRMRQIFNAAEPTLRISSENTDDSALLQTYTTVLTSPEIGKYLEANSSVLRLPTDDFDSALKHIIYSYGENIDRADFAADIDESSMYIRKEILNLRLHELDFANESKDSVGYVDSLKAVRVMASQYTPLWDPYLLRDMYKELPFVDPNLQREHIEKAVRAVIYAFCEDLIFAKADMPTETSRYFYLFDGKENVMTADGAPVAENDISRVLDWILSESAAADKWYCKYDMLIKQETDALPCLGIENSQFDEVVNAICASKVVSGIRNVIFPLAGKIENAKCRNLLLEECRKVISQYCIARTNDDAFVSDMLYREVQKLLMS